MSIYEGLFLLNAQKANRDWDETYNHVIDILKKHQAALLKEERWGERKLAYPVAKEKRGFYLLTYFEAEGDAVTRIYREIELSDTILRALILAVPGLPQPPPEPEEAPAGAEEKAAASVEGAAPAEAKAAEPEKTE